MKPLSIHKIARFPAPKDNAVIALRDLQKGLIIEYGDALIQLEHDVLVGHRFAAVNIEKGDFITSWNYPFGTATRIIKAGEYLCNQNVLFRLSIQEDARYTSLRIPAEPNFDDKIPPYSFNEEAWRQPGEIARYSDSPTFSGFERGTRGTGTRNHLVILSTTAATSVLVKRLEEMFQDRVAEWENVDSIVGIRHTEGEEDETVERNRTVRTLAGLMANPNVGGFVAIDSGGAPELSNGELSAGMASADFSEERQRFMSASNSIERDIDTASVLVTELLERLNQDQRTPQPIDALRIGLQCGASDAFSGISGNVLSGAIAREVICHGGAANLTETPELSGAEDYTLSLISTKTIAIEFLSMLDRFKQQLGWHGGKVDKNPSEGNLLGGLYNITLKSLGAAVKRDPVIPIEQVIEYGAPMKAQGFHFMDGMGGDIASYTGQAASGCNVILFVTGRGSPTNSSIVPTVKIVNTTERYRMMEGDIDINAGQYLDGQSMDELTDESLKQIINIASGEQTKGERRRQNIDLLWRRRFFHEAPSIGAESIPSRLAGTPIVLDSRYEWSAPLRFHCDLKPVALILPTVGCSVATAEQAAARLNLSRHVVNGRVDRFVVLPNTEGCGVTTGAEVLNFMLSYSRHPRVAACLFLSLGCEMVSPGFIKSAMTGGEIGFPEISSAERGSGVDPSQFGWLTIQNSGGTEGTIEAINDWFERRLATDDSSVPTESVRLGMTTSGEISPALLAALGELASSLLEQDGTVILSQAGSLSESLGTGDSDPTLCFAEGPGNPGLHVMECLSKNQIEIITGLGAVSDVILHLSSGRVAPANMLVPTLNVTDCSESPDFDLRLSEVPESNWSRIMAETLQDVLSGRRVPRQNATAHVGCQIPRGARAHVI